LTSLHQDRNEIGTSFDDVFGFTFNDVFGFTFTDVHPPPSLDLHASATPSIDFAIGDTLH
jgi:hypothetical protein